MSEVSKAQTATAERRFEVVIPQDGGTWTFRHWDGKKWRTHVDFDSENDARKWAIEQGYQAFRLIRIPAEKSEVQ